MEPIKKILRTPSAFVLFLIAIVSLIGVIIKSETDKAITRIPIDATSTAEARLTEIANFSAMTQLAILPSATWIPSPTDTETPTSTFTPTTTPSPTLQPSNTPSKTPIPSPTIAPVVFKGLDKNCISKVYWIPTPVYSTDKLTLDKNNCWNLSTWGILSENQTLKFVISDDIFNERVTRSIYTPISGNAVIQFKINVDLLTSVSDMDGVLFIGLGNKSSYSEPGYFLKYIVPAHETKSYFEFGPNYFNYWEPRIDYTLGDVQTVKITINGSDVSTIIDGIERHTNLHPSKREVLWIGYSTPGSKNYLYATISDFAIYEK